MATKEKYDFTERNVEVNSQQNEHFGQSFSCCEQPNPEDQPEEAAGLSHPGGCYWDLYHPVAPVCVPLMGLLQGLLTTTTLTPLSGIRQPRSEKLTVLIISLTSRKNARQTVMDSVTWPGFQLLLSPQEASKPIKNMLKPDDKPAFYIQRLLFFYPPDWIVNKNNSSVMSKWYLTCS
ncbi:hypothetical protein P7K49_039599 [Saguinus oedipus]|uniref:Uncharacterized protein n=1 Tax=Saguinus oedipus TaxID=9490 RepID=A0ABQ9T9V2_SAGOE|nr:hypothetical protein P7K49_039599 [Saguinus oedipus]